MCNAASQPRWRAALLALLLAMSALVCAPLQAAAPESTATSYQALIDVLEDRSARDQLIRILRSELDAAQAGAAAAETDPPADPVRITPARQLALWTQGLAEGLATRLDQTLASARALLAGQRGAWREISPAQWQGILRDLGLVILATLGAHVLLRRLAQSAYARADRHARQDHALQRLLAIGLAAVLDLLLILLAGLTGYGVGLFAVGEGGSLDTRATLFINAFVIIEVFKALLRVAFSPRHPGLRPFAMSDAVAGYWNSKLAWFAGLVGYGMLVVVPIVNKSISSALADLLGLLVMLGSVGFALRVILGNRRILRDRLLARAAAMQLAVNALLLRLLARTWHLLALGYLGILLVVSQLRPETALPFMAMATLKSLLAIGLGIWVSRQLGRLRRRGVPLSEGLRRSMPLLQRRLNTYVPAVLQLLRIGLTLAVLLFILDAWGLFDLDAWLASPVGVQTLSVIVRLALILGLSLGLWIAMASAIEHRLSPQTGRGEPGAREKTLLTLFGNALAVVFVTMTTMIALSQIGVDIAPLLAGAGVLGLAVGFGAQKLVQDIITGVFIQLENAMNTGDVVTVQGITGTVERLTIRSVGLRDLHGTFHLVPFSAVSNVSNFSRDFAQHVAEYRFDHDQDIEPVIGELEAAYTRLRQDPAQAGKLLNEQLEVMGITELGERGVTVRVRIKTTPGDQFGVGRAYNAEVKRHFDAAGIEIPYPHRTLHFASPLPSGSAATPPAGEA